MVVSIEQAIPTFLLVTFVIILVSIILKLFKQPYVIAYLLAGVLLGVLGIISDKNQLSLLGELGILLLMFFIGMEISLPRLISKWGVAILGTFFQILLSVGAMYLLGHFLNWSLEKSLLIGFIISLSSTAVIIKILEELSELHTKIGQNILGILIVQDVAVVPMMILVGSFTGTEVSLIDLGVKIVGAVLITVGLYLIVTKKIKIPLPKKLINNRELQVFTSLLVCFGLASITSVFGLSAALGAFFAGIIVSSYRGTEWAQESLHPFKVVFVALFFVYVGLMIDISFVKENWKLIFGLVLFVFLINTLINSLILKFLGSKTKESIYAGSLLAQVGEFSFLIGAAGLASGLIQSTEYSLIISVISLSLLFSPFWINLVKRIIKFDPHSILQEFASQFEIVDNFPRSKGKRKNNY